MVHKIAKWTSNQRLKSDHLWALYHWNIRLIYLILNAIGSVLAKVLNGAMSQVKATFLDLLSSPLLAPDPITTPCALANTKEVTLLHI